MLLALDSPQGRDPVFHLFSVVCTQDELPTRSDDLKRTKDKCSWPLTFPRPAANYPHTNSRETQLKVTVNTT